MGSIHSRPTNASTGTTTTFCRLENMKKLAHFENIHTERFEVDCPNDFNSASSDYKVPIAPKKHVTFAPTSVRKTVERSVSRVLKSPVHACAGGMRNHANPLSHNGSNENARTQKTENGSRRSILKHQAPAEPNPTSSWLILKDDVRKTNKAHDVRTGSSTAKSSGFIPLHTNMYDQSQPRVDEASTGFSHSDGRFESIKKQLALLQERRQREQYTFEILDNRNFCRPESSSYLLPCDEEESDRLKHLHDMLRFALQGNYLAPVTEILRKGAIVLDLGCGAGVWAADICEEYPNSVVVGLDIASILLKKTKPNNCAFQECNLLKPLPFDDNTFEYIFIRFLGQAVDRDKWTNLLLEVTRILKPYGWLEWIEKDYELYRPGPHMAEVNQKLLSLMTENHQDAHIGRSMASRLLETKKYMHISSTFVSCPGGPWAGRLGQLALQSWKGYYASLGPLLRRSWGFSNEKYNAKLKLCWREANIHKTFENIHFCYAQKRNTPDLYPTAHSSRNTHS